MVVGITTLINSCTRMCGIGVYFVLADVIAKMADVIAMRGFWQMLLPCG